jgi:sodium/proline symporter
MNAIFIGFAVYLLFVLFVGFLNIKRNRTQTDFFIGGRKLNSWVIAFSERASGESAWLLLGLPGAALATGLGESWAAIGCVAGIVVSWLFIAQKLRAETQEYDAMTLPQYFANKFARDSNSIRIIASLIIIFFFTFYVAAQFSGAGKVLNITFGIPKFWGIIIGASVILLYTLMGGFFAVAWTDMLQGIIMIGTLVILPVVGIIELGGFDSISRAMAEAGGNRCSWAAGLTGAGAMIFIVSGLSWGLGYLGQPHLVLRYMALRDPKDAKKASVIAIVWAVPAFTGAFLIGLVGLGIFGADRFKDVEQMMPVAATHLLPAWLAGIFICGAIAAMMSTADSQILVASSAVAEDFYHRVLRREPGEKKLVLISRITAILVGAVAFVLALTTKDLVFYLVSFAWGGLGASFGPIIVLSLYWKRLNKAGVIAGMVTGAVGTFFWKNIDAFQNFMPERLAAFVLAFAAAVGVSLVAGKNLR